MFSSIDVIIPIVRLNLAPICVCHLEVQEPTNADQRFLRTDLTRVLRLARKVESSFASFFFVAKIGNTSARQQYRHCQETVPQTRVL